MLQRKLISTPAKVKECKYTYYPANDVIEWKPPIQNDTLENFEPEVDHNLIKLNKAIANSILHPLPFRFKRDPPDYYEVDENDAAVISSEMNYYEIKVQTDRGDITVQITGTKCTLVPPACTTGTNIYSVRVVNIKRGIYAPKQRPANYTKVVCKEEISSVETVQDRLHVPGEWLHVKKVECPLPLPITTISILICSTCAI